MSDAGQPQATMKSLIERIDKLESERDSLSIETRFASLSGALGALLLAFTAMSWAVAPDGDVTLTLWDLADKDNPQGIAASVAILVLGTWTVIVALLPHPGKVSLGMLIGLAIAVAVLVLLVNAALPTGYGSFGDAIPYESEPACWLTLVNALVIAIVHGARLGQLHPGTTHRLRDNRY